MLTSFSTLLERFLNSDELLYCRSSTNVSFISLILALYKFHLTAVIGVPQPKAEKRSSQYSNLFKEIS